MNENNAEQKVEQNSKSKLLLNIILIVGVLLVTSYYIFSAPLQNKDTVVHVTKNSSLSKISTELKDKNVIRFSFPLKLFVYIFSGDKHIPVGDYLFKKGKNVLSLSWQLSKGIHLVNPIKITFKEGMTNDEMALLLADKMPNFRRDLFLNDSRSKQGYLFPDTYFIFPLSTTDEILNEMTINFNKKITNLNNDIKLSGKTLSSIIVMASILEKEASGKIDSAVISGILWKRLKLGMLLQVDASKETYNISGLPKNPICNPGLLSIISAIHPENSAYLFYLHDNEGNVHYAKDFSEHRSNIARYLK